jgi:hypothetical protein
MNFQHFPYCFQIHWKLQFPSSSRWQTVIFHLTFTPTWVTNLFFRSINYGLKAMIFSFFVNSFEIYQMKTQIRQVQMAMFYKCFFLFWVMCTWRFISKLHFNTSFTCQINCFGSTIILPQAIKNRYGSWISNIFHIVFKFIENCNFRQAQRLCSTNVFFILSDVYLAIYN